MTESARPSGELPQTGPVPALDSTSPPGGGTKAAAQDEGPTIPALGARNGRILLVAVVGYVALLSGLMIDRGVSVTPDVLLVALGLAALVLGRGRLFLRDWVPFIALFFAYELMRGYADDLNFPVHIADLIALERFFAFGHLPTAVLQGWVASVGLTDQLSVAATIVYFLHFPLPLVVGFLLWMKRRTAYYDYVAALIVLCIAGFVTYLLLPTAPPWLAAKDGYLNGPNGLPEVVYLKDRGFALLAQATGFGSTYLYSYAYYQMAANLVAAFPSLHAAFPFLAFLAARRAFGRVGWLLFGYFLLVVFAIVLLGDHYLVDAYAGVIYASLAWLAVTHAPARLHRWLDRLRDPGVELAPRMDRRAIGQGALLAAIGFVALAYLHIQELGSTGWAIVPWAFFLLGIGRAAAGLFSRTGAAVRAKGDDGTVATPAPPR